MVTIDQNNILKIFSVVTVLLLPPSVIGAFYGMNFEHIPWLHEPWGVWAALAMMVASALVPLPLLQEQALALAQGADAVRAAGPACASDAMLAGRQGPAAVRRCRE